MLGSNFFHYEVFVASDERVYFKGVFCSRGEAYEFLIDYLSKNRSSCVTDVSMIQIGTEEDFMHVENV